MSWFKTNSGETNGMTLLVGKKPALFSVFLVGVIDPSENRHLINALGEVMELVNISLPGLAELNTACRFETCPQCPKPIWNTAKGLYL